MTKDFNLSASVQPTLREAADLLEAVGTHEYVNPPTAEDMQRVAAQIRELLRWFPAMQIGGQ